MGLGNRGPDAGSGLAVSLAGQFVCHRGKFLSAAEVLWSGLGYPVHHPQCNRELCALARVNMSGTQEPSRRPVTTFPVP
jgi:hypothetical protein